MENLENGLGSVIRDLTPDNYEKSLELYRFRFELGDTYSHTSPNLIFDTIWKYQPYAPPADGLTCPNSSLIFRFATDAESDKVLGPHCGGLRQRLCKEILLRFFGHALQSDHSYCNRRYCSQTFLLHANQIAHAANLGYIEEGKICGHILPSLMSYSESGDCKAKVVTILFKIAGPTFEACADPSVVESCFEFLRSWKPKEAPNSRLQQQIKVSELLQGDVSNLDNIPGGGSATGP